MALTYCPMYLVEAKKMVQTYCPICTAKFKKDEVVVRNRRWEKGKPGKAQLAHLDCLLHVSSMEKRKHPPAGKSKS